MYIYEWLDLSKYILKSSRQSLINFQIAYYVILVYLNSLHKYAFELFFLTSRNISLFKFNLI